MADPGELNLGQLARDRFDSACCAIGMTTHEGEVTAAHQWEEPAALRTVRPSLPGSYERLFQTWVCRPSFYRCGGRPWPPRSPALAPSVPSA